jgi:hypothetical protein
LALSSGSAAIRALTSYSILARSSGPPAATKLVDLTRPRITSSGGPALL